MLYFAGETEVTYLDPWVLTEVAHEYVEVLQVTMYDTLTMNHLYALGQLFKYTAGLLFCQLVYAEVRHVIEETAAAGELGYDVGLVQVGELFNELDHLTRPLTR